MLGAGSDSALAFADSQSGPDISGDNISPSALMIRPTFSTSSSGYQASYPYKIKAITTDQIGTRINLASPLQKWIGGCAGSGSTEKIMTLAECNTACHALSTCYVIIYRESETKCWLKDADCT
jgi:hypothetical protein